MRNLLPASLLMFLAVASTASAAPLMFYSQDGKTPLPFGVIAGTQTAREFYDYRNYGGHPGFGAERGVATVAAYWDTTNGLLSLMFISGADDPRESGKVTVNLKDLPASATLLVADDPSEVRYTSGKSTAKFKMQYRRYSDGFVMGGLEQSRWLIQLTLPRHEGVKQWRLAYGGADSEFAFASLDPDQPLYVRLAKISRHNLVTAIPPTGGSSGGVGGGTGTPVPEPAMGLLLGGIAVLFLGRRYR